MAAGETTLLRIYLGEADRADGRPLYEALVLRAREAGIAGATVLRGPLGYGHGSHLHTAKVLRLSHDLPMIVEMVDGRQKLERFLAAVEPVMGNAVATLQTVELRRFGSGSSPGDGG